MTMTVSEQTKRAQSIKSEIMLEAAYGTPPEIWTLYDAPDWSLYDSFEIDGVVIEVLSDGSFRYEPVRPHETRDVYIVYAHRKDGGVDTIDMTYTARQARGFAADLMACSGIDCLNDHTL